MKKEWMSANKSGGKKVSTSKDRDRQMSSNNERDSEYTLLFKNAFLQLLPTEVLESDSEHTLLFKNAFIQLLPNICVEIFEIVNSAEWIAGKRRNSIRGTDRIICQIFVE